MRGLNTSIIKSFVLATFILFTIKSNSQEAPKYKLKYCYEIINDSIADIKIKVKLFDGYHLYSQYTSDESMRTAISFSKSNSFNLIGKILESDTVTDFDTLLGIYLTTFRKSNVEFLQKIKFKTNSDFNLVFNFSGQICKENCFPIPNSSFTIPIKINIKNSCFSDSSLIALKTDTENCNDYKIERLDYNAQINENQSYWLIFLLGFGGGLVALLTPCVFPMIPLTVSFFTKSSKTRRKGLIMAITYGLSIAAIYTLLAVPFIVAKVPPDTLNEIATSSILNIVFFIIFAVFSISFFGYFEIQLPSSFANKADNASNTGGFIGVFFMAITLALVSFSCTGPILGSFLAGTLASNPDPYNILFVMLGFGSALGLPFALFAAFPTWLNSLPKSGGWLNSVKVVLGFLELGMALKFLSNADLVEQWGLLKREPFLAIWAILAFGLTLYLLGFIRFPHDSKLKKRHPFRIALASFFLVCGVYFTSGIFGAGLELISGFPPPTFYSYAAQSESKNESNTEGDNHCPQGIPCEHDFEVAKARAIKENKPLLIDFTGWACVNCRRMEEGVWVDPEVKKIMSEDYVLVSLYVDEKTELPESEKFISCKTGKLVRTVGNKWSNMQVVNFNTNSQPLYVTLNPEGKVLGKPIDYANKEKYLKFLKEGLKAYRSK